MTMEQYVTHRDNKAEAEFSAYEKQRELNRVYENKNRRLAIGVALFTLASVLLSCPATYFASRLEPQNGTATKALRVINPEYKNFVTLPEGFMPSCSDFNQFPGQDESYSLRAFFSGCEVYPLKNSLDGKILTVLFVDNNFLGRNLNPDGFKLGIANVYREGGIFHFLDQTHAVPECFSKATINRNNTRMYQCAIGYDLYNISISQTGVVGISSPGNEPMIFQRSNQSIQTDNISLSEKLKFLTDSPLLTAVGSLLLLRFLGGLTGRGVRKIVVLKGPKGDTRYRELPIYGLKGFLIRAFRVPGYTNIQDSIVSGGPEPEGTAENMRSLKSILKAIAAFFLGR